MIRKRRKNADHSKVKGRNGSDSDGAPPTITSIQRWKAPALMVLFVTCILLWFLRNSVERKDEDNEEPLVRIGDADKDLFDCQRPNATCRSFDPHRFFSQGQPGHVYLLQLPEMGAELVNLPRMTHFHWSLPANSNNSTSELHSSLLGNLPSDITYFHLRKTGGTTIHHAIGHLSKYIRNHEGISTVQRYSTCRGVLRQQCRNEAQQHLQLIQQHQTNNDSNKNHIVFAVVRDPIHRFVSAMGQAMDNELGKTLRTKCLKESSSNETIHCVLLHLQTHGLETNVHFCPMAVNLFVVTQNLPIHVALVEQDDFPNILDYLGCSSSMMHMRNRSNPTYLQSNLLATLSVNDLDAAAIRILCRLYAVDVDMMHSLGLTVPLCDNNNV